MISIYDPFLQMTESFIKSYVCSLKQQYKQTTSSATCNVEVLGYIVSKYLHHNRTSFVVDDGTGLITCNLWTNGDKRDVAHKIYNDTQDMSLGQLVNIQGRTASFKNEIRITIQHIRIEDDPNSECLRWLEISYLKQKKLGVK